MFVAVLVLLGDPPDLVVAAQGPGDRVRQGVQLLDHPAALQARQVAEPAEEQGQHGQDRDLRGERLGAGDADLRPGVQVDAAVGLAGDRAADDVADGQRPVPLPFRLAQGGQRVGRLARLGDAR